MKRLEVILRVPDTLSRKKRDQLVELFEYVVGREGTPFAAALDKVGIGLVTVTTQNPALPQAPDAEA